jgi:hypothetical protein
MLASSGSSVNNVALMLPSAQADLQKRPWKLLEVDGGVAVAADARSE